MDGFSIVKRCCSWLEKVVFDRVWNEPYAEFRTNQRPRILNRMTEVSDGVDADGNEVTRKIYTPVAGVFMEGTEQFELPKTGRTYYVYALDVGFFDSIKLHKFMWTKLSDVNGSLLSLRVFSDSGRLIFRGGCYIRQSDHADMVLLAVDAVALHASCDPLIDDGYEDEEGRHIAAAKRLWWDPAAIYITRYIDSDYEPSYTAWSDIITNKQISDIRVYRRDPVPSGVTMALFNGRVLSGSYLNYLKAGEYLEYYMDKDICSTITIDRKTDCPIYQTEKGSRLLVHVPLKDNTDKYMITFNTCDVFLIPKRMQAHYLAEGVSQEISGVYLHYCERGDKIHQLTFNDFSIDLDLIDSVAAENGIYPEEFYIRIFVRTHNKKKGLMRDANYADVLYRDQHTDEEIISFLLGNNENIERYGLNFWTAAHLEEHSAYAQELTSRIGHAIPDAYRKGRYRRPTEMTYIAGKSYFKLSVDGKYTPVETLVGPIPEGVVEYVTTSLEHTPTEVTPDTPIASDVMEYRKYDTVAKQDKLTQCNMCAAYDYCTKRGEGLFTDSICPDMTLRSLREYVKIFGFFQTLSLICNRVTQYRITPEFNKTIIGFEPTFTFSPVTAGREVVEGEHYFAKRFTDPFFVPYREATASKNTMLYVPKSPEPTKLTPVELADIDFTNPSNMYCYKDKEDKLHYFRSLADISFKSLAKLNADTDGVSAIVDKLNEILEVLKDAHYDITDYLNPDFDGALASIDKVNEIIDMIYAETGKSFDKLTEEANLSQLIDKINELIIAMFMNPNFDYFLAEFDDLEPKPFAKGAVTDLPIFQANRTNTSKDYFAPVELEVGVRVLNDGSAWKGDELVTVEDFYIGQSDGEGTPIYDDESKIVHVRVPLVLAEHPAEEFEVVLYVNGLKVDSEIHGDCYIDLAGIAEIRHSYIPRLADDSFDAAFRRRLCVRVKDEHFAFKPGDFVTAEVLLRDTDNLDKVVKEFSITEFEDSDEEDKSKYALDPICARETIKQFDTNPDTIAISGHGTEYVFLNGLQLAPGIDYMPFTKLSKVGNRVAVTAQNVEYLDLDNKLEVISTSDVRIGLFTGYINGKWIDWSGISPFWYDNLSVMSIDGKVCTNFEDKFSGIVINDKTVENGRPYYIRTSAPAAAIRAMNAPDLMEEDTRRMRAIADYFGHFFSSDKFRAVIPREHKVYSTYLHAIISKYLTDESFDFEMHTDPEAFEAQFEEFASIKEQDVVYWSDNAIDSMYVDIYPTYHNLRIGSRLVRKKLAYMINMLTPTDPMRHREHING